jgi:hypothetical protein
MNLLKGFSFKKKHPKPISKKDVDVALQDALSPYIKREELEGYLKKIEKDKRKKALWDGLSNQKKIRLLRYLASRKKEERR